MSLSLARESLAGISAESMVKFERMRDNMGESFLITESWAKVKRRIVRVVAARDAGHKVQLLDLMGSGDNARIIQDVVQMLRPDVIGISVRNVDNQDMTETRFLLEPLRDIIDLCRPPPMPTL
jgi:hypothetical protein